MTDHIEEPAEQASEKPRVIIVIGGHDHISSSMSRRLMMLAAMQVVVLTGRDMAQEDAPPSLEELSKLILEQHHIPDMPPMLTALVPRDISHDYNAHAAYTPRQVDVGMAAKAHGAAERMAAKAVRFRHFHY